MKSSIIDEGQVLNPEQQRLLSCNFTRQDVKRVMQSIPNDKSPGMDGFNSFFFKHCWDIVGEEVADAVLDFFSTGKLLKSINVTSLTLIPKVKSPTHVSDFRPISCCSVIYKCITKLLCEKIKLVLPGLISQNQGAFVAQRSILHNVLLCQDIVKMYKPRQKQKCCLMKIDIQKAYDTVNWAFIKEILLKLGFPSRFVKLIMVCVESPTFSLMINGSPTGFFNSKRGIRQGDPMSPLLFILCMEYFSRIMTFIGKLPRFQFHPRCKSMALNHLAFVDDVILFCKGDFQSIQLMLQGIHLFAATSGLKANPQKSDFYSCGLSELENRRIMESSGFKHGRLPFRYLGVPISTTKLNVAECEKLIEKMVLRIRTWSSRHISFAGRCQLVNAVLLSINVYWSQIFILAINVLKQVNAICRAFLWTGTCNSPKPGYVNWTEVCKPKRNGGIGFRNLVPWNNAIIGKLVWDITKKADNLWVKWVHDKYIKQQDWRSYNAPNSASWVVKHICKAKQEIMGVCGSDWFDRGKYTTAETYKKLQNTGESLRWCKAIWDHHNIPKHCFVGWLAMKRRLMTRNRLIAMGGCQSDSCLLCENGKEDHDHLFFDCIFSKQCISRIQSWLGFRTLARNLPQLIGWVFRRFKGSKFRK